MNINIYERIKELAQQKNISIRELEHKLGFSNGTISKWKSTAPTSKINEVANYLNTSIDYLIGNENKNNTQFKMLARNANGLSDEDIDLITQLIHKLKNGNENDDNK